MNLIEIKEKLYECDNIIFRNYCIPHRNMIERMLMIGAFLVPIIWLILGLTLNDWLIWELYKSAGGTGILLVLLILIVSPLADITKLKTLLFLKTMRRPFGICSGLLIGIHGLHYSDSLIYIIQYWEWSLLNIGILFGSLWATTMLMLTLTSNNVSQKFFGKKWKTIQQGAYFALLFGVIHATLLSKEWDLLFFGLVYIILKGFVIYKKHATKSA